MKKYILAMVAMAAMTLGVSAKTLVVYYSYTNNVERIVDELKSQIDCDVVEIEPAEKGLDYAADNYAIGSALISAIRNNPDDASSYPAIDDVNVNLDEYDTVIIGAPLWWSRMAAPLQTYLFHNGAKLAGKNIGLIVSSASSGISEVVADAKRLIPAGNFLEPNLWIKSSQVSECRTLLKQWLIDIGYENVATGAGNIIVDSEKETITEVFSLNGIRKSTEFAELPEGIYVVRRNGKSIKVIK